MARLTRRRQRVRTRRGPVADLTRTKRANGERLGDRKVPVMENGQIKRDGKGKGVFTTVNEVFERKGQLEEAHASDLGTAEGRRLYTGDARLARNPQEVVSGRNIEGVTLTDISPNAAWKEAVFRFRAQRKMLPESFCRLLALKAWEKYVEFSLQRKPQLRIRIVVKFTYPNEPPRSACR